MSRKTKSPQSNAELIAQTTEDVRSEKYPQRSRDGLLIHPTEAIEVCRIVRKRLNKPTLSDADILGTFVNQSKRSKLAIKAAAKRREKAAS